MILFPQENLTTQTLIELALSEQLKERQEMEKKLQKLAKTMDYMERAKREEEAPLIEQAFQQRLVEEKILHEREQLVCFVLVSLVYIIFPLHISKVYIKAFIFYRKRLS